ncbi:MAG: hypothetical protein EBR82_67595 [Caulobacteraceae bacterium]|nr:hypothetical protein [Caulobacteraceae bacterium]
MRNARTVLGSQPVTEVLSERFGKGAVQRVAELVAIASGANMGPSHSLGRALEWLTRNVSRSLTQFSEQSHLKQLGGLFKIAAEMPASTVVRGLGGMFAADTRGEMMRDTAYLRARSSLPSQALFTQLGASGAMPTAGSARAAGRAVAASARQAGRRLLTLEWGKAGGDVADIIGRSAPALLDSISVAQWFDQMPARLAWAGFTAQAKAEGKGPAWVAEQTERAMRRSANPSNAMDQSGFAIAMRRSGLGFMIAFTGDPYKSFAQLYRANKVGGAYRAKVYAGVLGNVLWSAMVTVALKKGMEALGRLIAGGDDDDEKKWLTDAAERAGWLAAKDLAGIVPLGNAVAGAVEMLVKGKQQQGSVIDTPVGGALDRALRGVNQGFRGLRAAFEKRTDAEQARMVDDLLGGLWQSGVALGSLLGLPLPVVDRVQRNVRAGTKEVPRADELQKYRESKGEPTREDAKEITRARRRMVDGLLETDPERVADAMTDLERLGAKPKYRQIVDAMENAYPLAGVPKRERQKALLSLSPKRRAEVKREIDRWQRARERMYETVSRAKRSMATK